VELRGWVLRAAQVAFLAFAVAALADLFVTYHSLDRSYLTSDTAAWPRHEVLVAGLQQMHLPLSFPGWWALALVYGQAVVTFGLAALLFWHRPNQPIALLLGVFLMSATVATYPGDLADLGKTHPWEALAGSVLTYPFPAGLLLLAFVFPDGRFVPRWTVWPVAIQLAGLAYTFFPYPRDLVIWNPAFDTAQLIVMLVLAAGSQVWRYKRVADAGTRRQLRLFIIGFGVLLTMFVAFNVAIDQGNLDRPGFPPVWGLLFTLSIGTVLTLSTVLLGVLLVASILRYRLFDIELVLNRSLVLIGLTVGVIALYLGIVWGTQRWFHESANGVVALAAAAAVALAFQPLRLWLQRGANHLLYGQRDEPYSVLTGLGRRLENAITPQTVLREIVTAVTETLKLPYAAIRLSDGSALVQTGTPAPIAERIPLMDHDERLGELEVAHWPGTSLAARDRLLLADLVRHAGPAINSARLTQDLLRSRERLVSALEDERRRLRRDLHDGLGPRLAAMVLRVDTARDLVPPQSEADRILVGLGEGMADAIADIRRLVYGLRPPALDDLGLVGALRQSFGATPAADFIIVRAPAAPPMLSAAVEVAAFRIAQEAVTNVLRHAGATHCEVAIELEAGALLLSVSDDGRGMEPGVAGGVGLRSMAERAEELGGSVTISPRSGGGTCVQAVLPCTTLEKRHA
jgi:signal transduction histidine kinase